MVLYLARTYFLRWSRPGRVLAEPAGVRPALTGLPAKEAWTEEGDLNAEGEVAA
jgi:hypothetical protein